MVDTAADHKRRPRIALASAVILLLLIAAVGNGYLGYLFVEVSRAAGEGVDSFCNLGESANCVTVAASPYASFLGVPVALYGVEYYGAAAGIVLFSLAGWWRLRRWESLVFWAMIVALPISMLMAYFALFRVRSLCLICCTVYVVNLLVLLLLLMSHRGRLGWLATSGPRELKHSLSARPLRLGLGVLVALAISQLFWAPPLFSHASPPKHEAAHDHLPKRLVNAGLTVGHPSAPVKIIEFSDFQCSVCSRAHEMVVALIERYGAKIRFEHRDYPLDDSCNRSIDRPFHTHACQAAVYARCAGEQGKFWSFAKRLFANQHSLSRLDLKRYARAVGLSWKKLADCAASPKTRQRVLDDVEEGIRREVRGTPTFFVNGEEILGLRDPEWWTQKIAELTGPPASQPAPPSAPAPKGSGQDNSSN